MGVLNCVQSKIIATESTETFANTMSSQTSLHEQRRDLESQLLKPEQCHGRSRLWYTLGVDIPLILILAALTAVFEFGLTPHRKSGFFCNDPALSYPFNGDTVSSEVLVSTIIILPLALLFITELMLHDSTLSFRMKLDYVSRRSITLYRNYIFGLIFNMAVIEVMKSISGNPRPTFFAICEPDTAKTCNGSEYVSTFECTSTKFSKWYQRDSYHSFPSGHTSLSIHCGFFMAWYLQKRAFDWRHRSALLVPVVQLLCITYSAICSLTRITDHRHHWWDVLTGSFIGVVTLLYTVVTLCNNFKVSEVECSKNPNMTDSQQTVRTSVFDEPIPTPTQF